MMRVGNSMSRRAIVAASLAAAGLMLAASAAGAQSITIPGVGVPGVGVVVKHGPKVAARGATDRNGIFRAKLQPGSYSLIIDGQSPQPVEVPKSAGGVSVAVSGKKHNYVGHVTLLR